MLSSIKKGSVVLIDVSLPFWGVKLAVSNGPCVLFATTLLMVLCVSPVGLKIVSMSRLNLLEKGLGALKTLLE